MKIVHEMLSIYQYKEIKKTLQFKYDTINAPEMYNISHFTGRKADDFFPDRLNFIKHSLSVIFSQNKH